MIKIEKMSVIGELTSAVAHELRNPLTIIGGFANLMLKETISDGQREYLNIIASETRRTETVLSHLLEFHRDSKRENRPIDFSELVDRNLKLVKGRLNRPDIQIGLSLAGQKLPVFGNPDQLSHALYQLFHLVADDLIPPGRAEARTELSEDHALLRIRIICPEESRSRLSKSLKQIFSDNRASQRLSILVAGETIRYHGGTFGCAFGADGLPSLYMELPIHKEGTGA